jgi:hypothetical protein
VTYPTEQEVPSYTTTGTYSGVTKVDLVYIYPGNRTQLVADLVPSPQPALPNSAALGFAVGTAFPRQLSFAYTPTASDDTKAVAIFTKYGNEYYLLYFTFLNLASTFGANVSGDSPVLAITQLGFIESDINQQVAQLRKLYVGVLPLSSIGDVTGVDLSRASSPGPGQKWIGSIEATKTLPSQRFCLNDPASSSPQLGVFVASFVNGTVVNQGVKVASPPATLTEWSWTQTQGPAPSILTSGFPFTLQLHHEPLEAPEVSEIQEPASVELPTLPSYEDIAPWAPPSLFFPQVTPSTPAHAPSSRETLRNLV